MNGLNKVIQDIVKLRNYRNLKELFHQAAKVELQFKRRNSYKKLASHSYSWKDKSRNEVNFF